MTEMIRRFIRPLDRVPETDNAIDWLESTIQWDKQHPIRYRLARILHHVTHPKALYRHYVYWPMRTFWERGRRGWSVSDTWSIDHYLCKIVPEMVEHLRENGHGWPGEPMTVEEWNGILTQIADGFRAHATATNMDYIAEGERYDGVKHRPMEEALEQQFQEAGLLFLKWFGALWD